MSLRWRWWWQWRWWWAPAVLAVAALAAVACGEGEGGAEAGFAGQELTVVTHASFEISEATIRAFEEQHGVRVTFLKSGDTVETLNKAILTKGNPLGDLLFGVDNISYVRALAEGIFEPYESPALAEVDGRYVFDPSHHLTPIDFGYVLFNYDKAALVAAGLAPPERLEDLTQPAWRGRVAVQDPNTSSPGQQLMLVTIAYFGEEGDYTWLDFWRDLRANDVIVSAGWSDTYYAQFSHYGGPAWLVNSYATSPSAEVIFAEEPLRNAPTGNVIVAGGSYLQIEGVGILQGTKRRGLAERFIDYMLSRRFQEDIPLNMFVYPVRGDAALPQEFIDFAEIPTAPARIDPEQVAARLESWLAQWTAVVTR